MFNGIDLFSDTVTRPTVGMKKAILNASVGDEQRGEDPTTRQLEEMGAELLGHEAAIFLPSATMANVIAIRLLCEPGDELIAAENCHLFHSEGGGPAVHSGVMAKPIQTKSGVFTGEDVRLAYNEMKLPLYPLSKLVSIENTTNLGGGVAWDFSTLNSTLAAVNELGLKSHLDGARLFNASIASAIEPKKLASGFDTVTLCLSKGLGCPLGALLVFKKTYYEKVRRLKQLWGGSMRQSGIVAAAGIYAFQHHIERLAEDHANAKRFADRLLTEVPQIQVLNYPPSTNMVFFKWNGKITSKQFEESCLQHKLRFSLYKKNIFRAVTHLDISREDIEKVIDIIKKISCF